MNSSTLSRKLTAVCLAAAVLCAYSMVTLATPGNKDAKLVFGELTASGDVAINGLQAISGGTVFSDSTVSTAETARATINLGKLGRTVLSPGSNIKIGFTDSANTVSLDAGRVQVSVPAGFAASVLTKDGSIIADKSKAAVFTVDVTGGKTFITTQEGRVEFRAGHDVKSIAAGEEMMVGAAAPTAAVANNKKKALWIWLGIGIAVTILVIALTTGDDAQPPTVSPTT